MRSAANMWSSQAFGSEVVRSPNVHSVRQSSGPFQDPSATSSPSNGLQHRQRQSAMEHPDYCLEEGQASSQPLLPHHRDGSASGAVNSMNLLSEAVATLVLKPIKTKTSGTTSILLKTAISIMDNTPDSAWHKPRYSWLAPKLLVTVALSIAALLAFSQVLWSLHYVHTPDACNPTYPTLANHHTHEHIGTGTLDPLDIPVGSAPRVVMLTMHDSRTEPMPGDMGRWISIPPGTKTDILDLVWANRKAYADRHGYTLIDGTEFVDPSRPESWSKIRIVQKFMEQYDWVVWMDPDAWITNPAIKFEMLMPAQGYGDLVVTQDAAGFAAGVFVLRSSDWARSFLAKWWSMDRFIRRVGDKAGDNDALNNLLRNMPSEEFEKRVRVPVQCSMNSYFWRRSMRQWIRYIINPTAIAAGAWRPQHLLLHLAGWNKVKGLRMLFSTIEWNRKLPGEGLPSDEAEEVESDDAGAFGSVRSRFRKFLTDPLPLPRGSAAPADALNKGAVRCQGAGCPDLVGMPDAQAALLDGDLELGLIDVKPAAGAKADPAGLAAAASGARTAGSGAGEASAARARRDSGRKWLDGNAAESRDDYDVDLTDDADASLLQEELGPWPTAASRAAKRSAPRRSADSGSSQAAPAPAARPADASLAVARQRTAVVDPEASEADAETGASVESQSDDDALDGVERIDASAAAGTSEEAEEADDDADDAEELDLGGGGESEAMLPRAEAAGAAASASGVRELPLPATISARERAIRGHAAGTQPAVAGDDDAAAREASAGGKSATADGGSGGAPDWAVRAQAGDSTSALRVQLMIAEKLLAESRAREYKERRGSRSDAPTGDDAESRAANLIDQRGAAARLGQLPDVRQYLQNAEAGALHALGVRAALNRAGLGDRRETQLPLAAGEPAAQAGSAGVGTLQGLDALEGGLSAGQQEIGQLLAGADPVETLPLPVGVKGQQQRSSSQGAASTREQKPPLQIVQKSQAARVETQGAESVDATAVLQPKDGSNQEQAGGAARVLPAGSRMSLGPQEVIDAAAEDVSAEAGVEQPLGARLDEQASAGLQEKQASTAQHAQPGLGVDALAISFEVGTEAERDSLPDNVLTSLDAEKGALRAQAESGRADSIPTPRSRKFLG